MDGTIAILGFWLTILVLILKRPVSKLIEKSSIQNKDVARFEERCQKLEECVSNLSSEVIRVTADLDEIRNSSDFSYKLLLQQQNNLVAASTRSQTADGTEAGRTSSAINPEDFGKITNEHTVRFERVLPGSKEQVWKYFTQSDLLSQWLAEGRIDTQFGGEILLNFAAGKNPSTTGGSVNGLVSRYEEGKALCFSWNDASDVSSLVSIEFSEEGSNTRVVLTHSRLPQDRLHHFMAYWHTYLDTLVARLKNITPPDFNKRFREVVQIYLVLVATVMAASPALADDGSYKINTSKKSVLMTRYDHLWQDVDKNQRKMDQLRRENTSASDQEIDYLDKEIKNQYRDIKKVEYEIKDLDAVLKL